ncbi:MAG: hypothetical protein ACK5WP_09400 [Neisseriaceae bacterium]
MNNNEDIKLLTKLVNDIKAYISRYIEESQDHFPKAMVSDINDIWDSLNDNIKLENLSDYRQQLQNAGLTGQQLKLKITVFDLFLNKNQTDKILEFISIILGSLSSLGIISEAMEALKEFFEIVRLLRLP